MHICTIVARNYLAAARVLARSFAAHNPDGTCWTLVIDDADHEIDGAGEPFEAGAARRASIAQWDQMVAGYSVLELSTAVKPWLLATCFTTGGPRGLPTWTPTFRCSTRFDEVSELLRRPCASSSIRI